MYGILLTCLFGAQNLPPDGTLLFVENGSNIIEQYTDSTYTHVAIIVTEEGTAWVYEATPPKVRRVTLEHWLTGMARYNERRSFSPALVSIAKPKKLYTEEQVVKLKEYLESQRGRVYSLRGYVRNRPTTGIHCSELCAGALEAMGSEFSTLNYRISPADLRRLVEADYHQHNRMSVSLKEEFRRSTCTRWWDWWRSRGMWCRWSCWETLKWW
jgi:hypothetical protein